MRTREDYRAFADDEHLDLFYAYISQLETLVAENGWTLNKYFRSYWCAFKSTEKGEAAFGIGLEKLNLVYLYIKRVQAQATSSNIIVWSRYKAEYNQVEYLLEPGKVALKPFQQLLQLGYERSKT